MTNVNKSLDVYVIQNVISNEECDYFSQKLICMWKEGKLSKFFDVPEVLIIENDDKENRLFIQKCYNILSNQVKEKYKESLLKYMDGSLSLWRPGIQGTSHVDNADPKIKSYGAKYSAIFYLNDDYEGGEIEFPNLNFSYKPVKGSLVWFPNEPIKQEDWQDWFHHKHLHQVKKVLGNYRCTLPIWIG